MCFMSGTDIAHPLAVRSWNHILYTVTEAMSWDSYIDNLKKKKKKKSVCVRVRACVRVCLSRGVSTALTSIYL